MNWDPYEAARKGAELLDERVPGWASNINQDELDMNDCYDCVLGQQEVGFRGLAFDLFGSGVYSLWDSREIEAHGFSAPARADGEEDVGMYAALDDAWQQQINKRL